MKKIKSITEYPFISYILNWVMDFNDDYIYIESKDKEYKKLNTAINKLINDPIISLEISDLITNLNTQYENEGFLNGYIMATKVLKGELM